MNVSTAARKKRKREGVKFIHTEKTPTGRSEPVSINPPLDLEALQLAMRVGREMWDQMTPRSPLQ